MFILMKIIHPSHTDKLHAALGGHLVKFEGAGHAVTEECLVCSLYFITLSINEIILCYCFCGIN